MLPQPGRRVLRVRTNRHVPNRCRGERQLQLVAEPNGGRRSATGVDVRVAVGGTGVGVRVGVAVGGTEVGVRVGVAVGGTVVGVRVGVGVGGAAQRPPRA